MLINETIARLERELSACKKDAEEFRSLLVEVMAEGVEHETSKYAVVQMGHELRQVIRDTLARTKS